MSKRDTTGGPKPKARVQAEADKRVYLSRAERDRLYQQYVLMAIALLGVIVAIIFVVALINDRVVLPGKEISTVNGEQIIIEDFRERVKYDRYALAEQIRSLYESAITEGGMSESEARNQVIAILSQQQSGPLEMLINTELFGQQVLNNMEGEFIIAKKAEELGITVDEAAIDQQVEDTMTRYTGRPLRETPTSTPSDVPTETATPLVTATISPTPSETLPPTETLQPTAIGCAEGEECPTVTPLPTLVPSITPTASPEVSETPTSTSTPLSAADAAATTEKFQQNFLAESQDESGLSEEAVRDVFRYAALSKAVRDAITSDSETYPDYFVGNTETFVELRHILIQFPEDAPAPVGDDNDYFREAQALAEALRAGEPFAALAQAHSDDPGSVETGGFYGWQSVEAYDEAFGDAAEILPIGEISEPVRSQFGYHIIQVLDREGRTLTESQEETRRDEQFSTWLQDQRLVASITRRESWQDFIPTSPDINDLLEDVLGKFDFSRGIFETGDDE